MISPYKVKKTHKKICATFSFSDPTIFSTPKKIPLSVDQIFLNGMKKYNLRFPPGLIKRIYVDSFYGPREKFPFYHLLGRKTVIFFR